MSKPMTLSNPAMPAVRTMPTTPPAGPDNMLSLPWNRRASVNPPFDCMNISVGPAPSGPVSSPATRST